MKCITVSTSPIHNRRRCQPIHRYITDRHLPDKAIDLIDEAASRIRMEMDSKPESMEVLDRRSMQLKWKWKPKKRMTKRAKIACRSCVKVASIEADYAELEKCGIGKSALKGS